MKKSLLIPLFFLLTVWLGALTPEEELYTQAEARYRSGNYAIALEFYNTFIKTYPLSGYIPDLQFRKAVCLFRLKQYKECLSQLENIKKRYKTTRYYTYLDFWAGLSLYYLADYTRSIDSFNAFLTTADLTELITQSLLYKGMGEIVLESYSEARDTIEKLVTGYPAATYYQQGVILLTYVYYKLQLYDKVIALARTLSLTEFKPAWQDQLLFYQAEALVASGDPEAALSLYRQLLDAEAEISSVAYRRIFLAEQASSNISQMEQLLQQAEEHFAGSYTYLMDFWLQVGVESFKQGNLELADHLLNKVWNVRSKETIDKSVPLYLSEIQAEQKKYGKAREILLEFLRLQKDSDGSITIRLGDLYLKERDYTQAAGYYTSFLSEFSASPRGTEVSYFLAYCYYKQKQTDKALSLASTSLQELKSGKYYRDFLKLRAYLLKDKGNLQQTIAAFQEYVDINKEDIRVLIDLLKLWFQDAKYAKIIEVVDNLLVTIPLLEQEDPWSFLMAAYLRGLSYVSLKKYQNAVTSLAAINGIKAGSAGLAVIVPYAIFYNGWSHYKLRSYQEAISQFEKISANYPSHELLSRALYFTGWCYYTEAAYDKAIAYFTRVLSGKVDKSLAGKTTFFIAKAYTNQGKKQEAADRYKDVYLKYPEADFADDAMFEYAIIQVELGKINDAVKGLVNLTEKYSGGRLVEEAAYKIGEIYYQAKQYDLAKEAFYHYRTTFPAGKFLDSALYWGGLAALQIKEPFGAALLWEILIDKHTKSIYRADAILEVAQIYAADKDYSQAIKYYTLLKSDYPKDAANALAGRKIEELRYLILGLDDTEAKLTAAIDQLKGLNSLEGRKAILDLAQFYLNSDEAGKLDLAYKMLRSVADKQAEPETTARALYLAGEYFFRTGDYIKAGNEFLKAAIGNPANKDQMAASILKAAEMMKLAGKNKDLKELVNKLNENFPESQWTEEGRKLLEGVE